VAGSYRRWKKPAACPAAIRDEGWRYMKPSIRVIETIHAPRMQTRTRMPVQKVAVRWTGRGGMMDDMIRTDVGKMLLEVFCGGWYEWLQV